MFKLSCLRRNLFLPASFSARTPIPQTPARQGQMFQKNHKLFVYCAGFLPLPLPPASGHVFRWLRSQGLKILLEFSGLFCCSVVKVPPTSFVRQRDIYYHARKGFSIVFLNFLSRSVIPIYFYIIIGQVTAPCLGRDISLLQVYLDIDFVFCQDLSRLFLRKGHRHSILASNKTPRL